MKRPTPHLPLSVASTLVLICMTWAVWPAPSQAQVPSDVQSFDYDYTTENVLSQRIDLDAPDPELLRDVFQKRRQRVMEAMPGGAMLVFSVEWVQPRRLEFQVQHSDNHDFIYLTGLEGLQSVESALLLLPGRDVDGAPRNWVVLYSSQADLEQIGRITGIADVRPFHALEEDLSVAMTDYRDWRITQIRRWPLPAALSRQWGDDHKVLYLNYPRFFRLGMPEPERLTTFDRFRRFSPDMELRDAADVLDRVRLLQDGLALASLRRAVEITGEGIVEAFRYADTRLLQHRAASPDSQGGIVHTQAVGRAFVLALDRGQQVGPQLVADKFIQRHEVTGPGIVGNKRPVSLDDTRQTARQGCCVDRVFVR